MARDLLGKVLVYDGPAGRRAVRLVEVEAYLGASDPASHAYRGPTARTAPMFGPPGRSYVYFVYGMYHQFNVVTNVRDAPHAVLVRALEPVEGIARMRRRRPGRADHDLTNGPGKLCAALGISRSLDGADLLGPRVWLEEGRREVRASQIAVGPRVGIDYAQEWADKPWRFWIKGNPYVSRSATPRLTPRPRSS